VPKKQYTISGQLRAAILAAPVTQYRIGKETDIAASVLSRFVNGKSGLDLPTVDRLCGYLGLELQSKGKVQR
jgi:transcriptional regulator with XRE-family HTH domain